MNLFGWFKKTVEPVEHKHKFQTIFSDEDAPIDDNDPIAHTAFSLWACECGRVEAWPDYNYQLTTPRYKQVMKKALVEKGWTFHEGV